MSDDVDVIKQRQIARVHELAKHRDPNLCTWSKDGRFCENKRILLTLDKDTKIIDPEARDCFCKEHQDVPRYSLTCFNNPTIAWEWSKAMRMKGYNANVWQRSNVIIGLTTAPTVELLVPEEQLIWVRGYFEAQMYEDVLMLAIDKLNLDLSHIMGRGSNQ